MWKKFSIRILVFVSLVILFVGGVNLMIDPYDIFGSPKIEGFNANKPEVYTHVRICKTTMLLKLKPKTVFVGTSRMEKGIDSANPNFDAKTSYNCAISNGLPVEYEYYIDAAIKNGMQHIIVGVDLFAYYAKGLTLVKFDKKDFEDFRAAKYIVSADVFLSSLKTIHTKNASAYLSTGMRNPLAVQDECERDGGHKKIFQSSEKYYFENLYRSGFSKSQTAHWQAFERILDKAHKNSIKVTLFVSPSHARQWEVLSITQGWTLFEEYRRRLVEVNEKVALRNHKQPFVLWDFAGYHPLTTESVPSDPKAKMKWYWDSSHYKKELGDIVLDRMFDGNFSGGQDYLDFGVKLTAKNIDLHLAKLRDERVKWRVAHPTDVVEIEALKR